MAKAAYTTIEGVRVDIPAIQRLAHTCNPAQCTGAKTCCSFYEVRVSAAEADRIVGLLPHAARYAKHLRDGQDFTYPFEDEDRTGAVLATDDDGLCKFAFKGRDGGVRCSLHAAALDLGLPPHQNKPRSCALWPLALSEDQPPVLTVQPGALAFPCNRARRPGRALHPGVRDTLATLLGEAFVQKLERKLENSGA